ncbi:Hypothetical protein CAP_6749 [Chondromyces apiculatus DSM 436]|uniref:Uncharacterized protein n=1 Tax=Chondromyces apiculatus DSM 436 TaxID=1192034 RepID=A0A017T0R0_9BACT|nr:Hypothetical protein CAP_6749 [Chondromyces apiculatus DSM 436]
MNAPPEREARSPPSLRCTRGLIPGHDGTISVGFHGYARPGTSNRPVLPPSGTPASPSLVLRYCGTAVLRTLKQGPAVPTLPMVATPLRRCCGAAYPGWSLRPSRLQRAAHAASRKPTS